MVLTQVLESGYGHYRRAGGFPGWLMPEHQMARLTAELGDEGIRRLSDGLVDTAGIGALSEIGPISEEAWSCLMGQWATMSQVAPGAVALLAAGERLLGCYRQGRLRIEPEVICRALSVLFLAPQVPAGKALARSLAKILERDNLAIAGLINSYADKLIAGDVDLVKRIDECICSDQTWRAWWDQFLTRGRELPFVTKPVAITPELTPVMVEALRSMVMKGGRDEH